MTDVARAIAELTLLERIHADFVTIAARTDDNQRRDLVLLRKRLADQTALIGQIAEPLFVEDAVLLAAFRQHYSAMRSTAALHQAEWPAFRFGESESFAETYSRSATALRKTNRTFVTWLRDALLTLARGAAESRMTRAGADTLARLVRGVPENGAFARRMQLAELDYIAQSDAIRTAIAESYMSLPL